MKRNEEAAQPPPQKSIYRYSDNLLRKELNGGLQISSCWVFFFFLECGRICGEHPVDQSVILSLFFSFSFFSFSIILLLLFSHLHCRLLTFILFINIKSFFPLFSLFSTWFANLPSFLCHLETIYSSFISFICPSVQPFPQISLPPFPPLPPRVITFSISWLLLVCGASTENA